MEQSPIRSCILAQGIFKRQGEGFQLQTYIHVGVRNINRKEHLWVTEVPAETRNWVVCVCTVLAQVVRRVHNPYGVFKVTIV